MCGTFADAVVRVTTQQTGRPATPNPHRRGRTRATPLPTEVLDRAKAIGLNPTEAHLRAGEFPLIVDEVIDYTEVDFAEAVRDVDVILDTLGDDTADRSLGVLRPGAHLAAAVAEEDAGSSPSTKQRACVAAGATRETR